MYKLEKHSIRGKPSHSNRVVYIDLAGVDFQPNHRTINEYPPDFTDNTQLYGLLDSADERIDTMERREPLEQGECVPMKEWQTTFHPSCNGVHELGLADLGSPNEDNNFDLFGTKGYWRHAWKVDHLAGTNSWEDADTVVLKTLK